MTPDQIDGIIKAAKCGTIVAHVEALLAAAVAAERKEREEEKTRLLVAFETQYKKLDADLRPQLKAANEELNAIRARGEKV